MTTLLLVEDSVELAQAVIRAFESAGYQVHHAADGEAALELHARHRPDIIILGWMLPRLDGLAVLRTILLEHSLLGVLSGAAGTAAVAVAVAQCLTRWSPAPT